LDISRLDNAVFAKTPSNMNGVCGGIPINMRVAQPARPYFVLNSLPMESSAAFERGRKYLRSETRPLRKGAPPVTVRSSAARVRWKKDNRNIFYHEGDTLDQLAELSSFSFDGALEQGRSDDDANGEAKVDHRQDWEG